MTFDRRTLTTLAALGASLPLALAALGPFGLVAYLAAWFAALPLILPRFRATLTAELLGVLFLFATAAFADNLDDVLGTEQRVSLALVAASFGYLLLRADDARAVARSPLVALVALFYAQQIASAWWLGSDATAHLVQNRISLLAALLAAAVLIRRDGALVLWLVVLAALVSVPIMLYEVARPDVRLFSFTPVDGPVRAGGLYGQSNVVGIALDLAIGALLALRARGDVSRGVAIALAGALGVGVIACASRGALLVALALVAARAWTAARRSAGRAPLATALLAGGVVFFALPTLGRAVVAHDRALAAAGFEGVDRLNEVVLALTGSTDDLADDDSGHLKYAAVALRLSADHPLVGVGTGRFSVSTRPDEIVGAHMQLLQILGENGAVGLALYFVLLWALVRAAARAHRAGDAAAALLVGVWLLAHLESHDLHSYRFTMLPLAWLAAFAAPAQGGAPS